MAANGQWPLAILYFSIYWADRDDLNVIRLSVCGFISCFEAGYPG